MAWAPLFLVLSAHIAGSLALWVLVQPPSVSVPPGQRAELSCSADGIGSKIVHWYQQRPGSAPRLIIRNDDVRPSGIPERFSGSNPNPGSRATLTVAGTLLEDDAVYFCQIWDSGAAEIFGPGTQMNILSGETKAPALNIFPPSIEETAGKKATLVCQGQNYYPAALVWSWTVNGQTTNTGVDSTRPTKQTEDNLFMAASFLSIDAVDWKADKTFTCIATHEGKTFQASVKQSECV